MLRQYLECLAQWCSVQQPAQQDGGHNLQHMDAPMYSRPLDGAAVAVCEFCQVEGPHVNQLAS